MPELVQTQLGLQRRLLILPHVHLPTSRERSAVCLEAQHHPDAIHHPNFPNTVLEPGETFRSTTRLTFRAE